MTVEQHTLFLLISEAGPSIICKALASFDVKVQFELAQQNSEIKRFSDYLFQNRLIARAKLPVLRCDELQPIFIQED